MKDGPIPGMPETNKKVRLTGVGLANVRDGKFVEVWNVVDFPKMAYDLDENTPDVE
jgi:predicted ester cyclase